VCHGANSYRQYEDLMVVKVLLHDRRNSVGDICKVGALRWDKRKVAE
jgi:hypothetical protein